MKVLLDKEEYDCLKSKIDSLELELAQLKASGPYKRPREIAVVKVNNKINKVKTVCDE